MFDHADTVLSRREMDVIKLVAEGYSNQQIARALFITTHTVKNHVHNILIKLQLNNRLAAAIWYRERARALESISSRGFDPIRLQLVQCR